MYMWGLMYATWYQMKFKSKTGDYHSISVTVKEIGNIKGSVITSKFKGRIGKDCARKRRCIQVI